MRAEISRRISASHLKITATGANDRQIDPELRPVCPFSANSLDFSFSVAFLSSEKSKGGPFDEKNLKKIDFYV